MKEKLMNNINNWTEISKGYYRYAIGPNLAYEIIIECWYHDTPIETAKGSLCIVGVWRNPGAPSSTEREWILKEQPVQHLLEAAVKDNDINNK